MPKHRLEEMKKHWEKDQQYLNDKSPKGIKFREESEAEIAKAIRTVNMAKFQMKIQSQNRKEKVSRRPRKQQRPVNREVAPKGLKSSSD